MSNEAIGDMIVHDRSGPLYRGLRVVVKKCEVGRDYVHIIGALGVSEVSISLETATHIAEVLKTRETGNE